jgi:hypothetical protein
MMSVEGLFFIADLKGLAIPWVNALVVACGSQDDVEGLWRMLRCWGPADEDVEDIIRLSSDSRWVTHEAERLRMLVQVIESWRGQFECGS